MAEARADVSWCTSAHARTCLYTSCPDSLLTSTCMHLTLVLCSLNAPIFVQTSNVGVSRYEPLTNSVCWLAGCVHIHARDHEIV